jgi:hypothetical protein
MSEEKRYTEAEAQRYFAIEFNGQTWNLLEKTDRSAEEDALMVHSAHASHRHWVEAGTGVHQQRGEWLIARAYAVLGLGEAALRHANRCLELTKVHSDLMADFDWAFAYEGVARASAIAGQKAKALEYIEMAAEAGQAIADEQNREIFVADFDGGDWAGLR